MTKISIYHNSGYSKSRAVLALLEENHVSSEIIYYLETPPSTEDLKSLLEKLGLQLHDIIRRSEVGQGQ